MSDIPDSVLVALRNRLRELEMDAVMIRGRIEELMEAIASIEHAGRRRGRPRKLDADIVEIPQGTLYDPDAEPPIEEAQSTLKETVA
jgi:7,8-dihydro-6-hydroxymethylpterin-pyrophosphokinase